jgi:hypothetical protein
MCIKVIHRCFTTTLGNTTQRQIKAKAIASAIPANAITKNCPLYV